MNCENTRGVSIVAPTFREAGNLVHLARRIETTMAAPGLPWELILSDDDSDDGTQALARKLAESLPVRLHVRRNRPRDLSRAVLDGLALARFDRLVVLDADLSHPPEQIPDLLELLDDGADMAVGSRYAPGGRIEGPWSRRRSLNSRLATLLARPLVRCSDPMSGFFALRRGSLPPLCRLDPTGFKIGLELMVRGGLSVRDVPIRFGQRFEGSSKLTWRQQVAYLRHLLRLYRFRYGVGVRARGSSASGNA